MSTGATAIVIVAAILVIAAIIAFAMANRRRRLRRRRGPEYDRLIDERNNRGRGEAELTQRQRPAPKLDIRPLSNSVHARYLAEWRAIREQFLDSPQASLTEAYALVATVMRERGYPITNEYEVITDLPVARTVQLFRAAQAISREVANGSVATEDLRQALVVYRKLFADLLGPQIEAADDSALQVPADTEPDGVPVITEDARPDSGQHPER